MQDQYNPRLNAARAIQSRHDKELAAEMLRLKQSREKRMEGFAPVKKYTLPDPSQFEYVNASDLGNISKSVASYIVAQNYYLLRDKGTTYILNTTHKPKQVLRLMKDPEQDFDGDNSYSIRGDTKAHPMVNLTETEHADILKAKPSYSDLMHAFVQANNPDDLQINFTTAERVW